MANEPGQEIDTTTTDVAPAEGNAAVADINDDDAQDASESALMEEIFGVDVTNEGDVATDEAQVEGTPPAGTNDVKSTEGEGAEGEQPAPEADGAKADDGAAAKEGDATDSAPATGEEEPLADPNAPAAEWAQQLDQFNEQAVTYLAENVYALSEEQVEQLESDPGKALPQMAATMHLQVMRAATLNISRMLPQMVQNITQVQTRANQFETDFFEANKDLVPYREDVLKYGAVYRQMHPQTSNEDFIRDVGNMVRTAHNLQAQAAAKPQAQPVVQDPPYKPASTGGGVQPQQKQPTNEFEILANEVIDE